jgi:ligand-binding sensor domain-containing protein
MLPSKIHCGARSRLRNASRGNRCRWVRGLWIVLACWLAALPMLAGETGIAPRQYRETTWDVKDGLPDSVINIVLQTRDHYLWLGTEKGVVRFDGVRFQVFDTWNTKELHSERISALCEDAEGNLWIGTKGGGVTRYRDGAFSHAGLSSQFVSALCAGHSNRVWVGTSGGGLFVFHAGKFENYSTSSGLPDLFVSSLCAGRDGSIWIGTRNAGLVAFSNGAFQKRPLPAEPQLGPINALFEDEAARLWLGTAAGLVRVSGGQTRTFTSRDGLPADQVLAIGSDRQTNFWVATSAGAVNFPAGSETPAGSLQAWMRNDVVSSCCVDVEGNVWLTTAGSGLKQLAPTRFAVLSSREGLSHEVVSCVLEGRGAQLWFGTYGGLNRLSGGVVTAWGTNDGLAHSIVTALLEDVQGVLWIGTQEGLNRLGQGRLLPCPRSEGWPQISVWAFHQDQHGTLWIGTADGLFQIEPRSSSAQARTAGAVFRVTRHAVENGLPSNDIRALAEGQGGRLWIGTSHGLAFRQDGAITPLKLPSGSLTRIILCLQQDADGVLWCGTLGGGLIRLRDGSATTVTMKEGFPDSTIYQILDDGLGCLWLTSNRGVFQISKAELNKLARQEIRAVTPMVYGRADGLPSEECKGFSQPAGCKSRDGRLWFPTSKGVAVVDPARTVTNRVAPPVVLEQVIADNKRLAPAAQITLKPGSEKLEFHFVALSLAMPERVRFKYLLEGFDKDWTDAGARRVAYYTRIPPGRYRFRVTACNLGGAWNETGVAVAVTVHPEFWQTAWFRLGAIAALGLGILGVHLWRLARVRALERLRLRIARDLHDEVGSNLGSIVLLTQVAPQPAPAEMADIRRVATATIDALRDIVWFINPAHDKLSDVVQRMQETARTMLQGVPHEFRQGPLPADQEPSLLFRQNVLPLFKEILNNAAQHAHPVRVKIEVEAAGSQFRLRVRDDGAGFDETKVKLGNGLRNLRRRTEELGGTLAIDSAPGSGTTVTLTARIT